MLSYLSRNNLYQVDPAVLYRFASRQYLICPFVLRLLHTIPDDYLIDGRPFPHFIRHWHVSIVLTTSLAPTSSGRKLAAAPWNIAFSPSVTERFNVPYQLSRMTETWPVESTFMLIA
jgi:hypothetical protein